MKLVYSDLFYFRKIVFNPDKAIPHSPHKDQRLGDQQKLFRTSVLVYIMSDYLVLVKSTPNLRYSRNNTLPRVESGRRKRDNR